MGDTLNSKLRYPTSNTSTILDGAIGIFQPTTSEADISECFVRAYNEAVDFYNMIAVTFLGNDEISFISRDETDS